MGSANFHYIITFSTGSSLFSKAVAESAASECLSHGTFLSSVEASQSFLLSFSVGEDALCIE